VPTTAPVPVDLLIIRRRLRVLRKAVGFSQGTLAHLAHTHQREVSAAEKWGSASPANLVKWAAVLGYDGNPWTLLDVVESTVIPACPAPRAPVHPQHPNRDELGRFLPREEDKP
jgi:hypothetical protein